MMNKVKRIAINTGGGDAPGFNAVIHVAVYAALQEKPEGGNKSEESTC